MNQRAMRRHALIAVDLGAESCRVSLLRFDAAAPVMTLVHRFANAPMMRNGALRWDFASIEAGVEQGLRRCAELAPEGIASIGVDGWAVDYVRLGEDGRALDDPFCYRDERTIEAEIKLHERIGAERLRAITGVQLLRINTVYQLYADSIADTDRQQSPWLTLPEYLLHRLGGAAVAERTNASHTQMLALADGAWSEEIFSAAGLAMGVAPRLVPPGTDAGRLSGSLAALPAFADTRLIAPACHDTASAIAGIPARGDDWAYISSGTWSLVGMLLDTPRNDEEAARENFTNLSAVGGRVCFHKSVNGMWLLKQCMEIWAANGRAWDVAELVAAAEQVDAAHGAPEALLDVDDPPLLLAGDMPQRINAQRAALGLALLDERAENAPVVAHLIFHSLAARYAEVLRRLETCTGKRLRRLFVVGGGSRNAFLNRLTQEATGLELMCCATESATVGNFAVQLAVLEGHRDATRGADAERVAYWAERIRLEPM
jgi:rhamnulokinase